MKSPRLDFTRRLNIFGSVQSILPQVGHLILDLLASKISFSSVSDIFSSASMPILPSSLSTRMRVWQFLHSDNGSEKPPTWPEATQVSGALNMAESRPT